MKTNSWLKESMVRATLAGFKCFNPRRLQSIDLSHYTGINDMVMWYGKIIFIRSTGI